MSSRTAKENGHRVPPGQHLTKKFPVLHAGTVPKINPEKWLFKIWGLVKNDFTFDLKDFQNFPKVKIICDIHCVTRWTKLDTKWGGVKVKDVLNNIEIQPSARFALVHGENNFTTNVPLEILMSDNVILADEYEDEALSPEHGWPLRLVVPQRYFWKSAKWVTGIELLDKNVRGFWEKHGYHMEGDPWKEQRYSSSTNW